MRCKWIAGIHGLPHFRIQIAEPKCTTRWPDRGAGYGFELLARAARLEHCRIHCAGDIDACGLAILDRLRAHLPNAPSMLMGRANPLAIAGCATRWVGVLCRSRFSLSAASAPARIRVLKTKAK